jgi:Tripartite ATP-independent periplasmic transporter, DctM component
LRSAPAPRPPDADPTDPPGRPRPGGSIFRKSRFYQIPGAIGLVLTLNLAIGQQTPPVASVLIASCAIAKSDIWETTKVNLPFIAALVVVLLLCTYVPWISLALVSLFYGS